MGKNIQRSFTLYPNESGEIVARQERSRSEEVQHAMLDLSRFRGSDYRNIDQVPQDQLLELETAVMEGKMWWATFPKTGNGIPWGHDNVEIADRFPSVKEHLSVKRSWWKLDPSTSPCGSGVKYVLDPCFHC